LPQCSRTGAVDRDVQVRLNENGAAPSCKLQNQLLSHKPPSERFLGPWSAHLNSGTVFTSETRQACEHAEFENATHGCSTPSLLQSASRRSVLMYFTLPGVAMSLVRACSISTRTASGRAAIDAAA